MASTQSSFLGLSLLRSMTDDHKINNSRYHHVTLVQRRATYALMSRERTSQQMEIKKEPEEDKKEQKVKVQAGTKGAAARIVAVNPRCSKGPISDFINRIEDMLAELIYGSSRFLRYRSGNFAPVQETAPTADLHVNGHIPHCINGQYMQVVPNSKFAPISGYHWFDGDGMIHSLRIKNGKATYVSRYVETSRLKQEEYFGRATFLKVGDLKGFFGIFMVVTGIIRATHTDYSYGLGTSNNGLVYHNGMLLALQEIDKPYVVKILENGDLQTLGMLDYDKRLKHPFGGHPKVDPVTGEMFAYGYSQLPPYVTYRVVTKDGFMHDPVPITVSGPIMMHDFAITESYAIFMDLPMHLSPLEVLKGNNVPFVFDGTKNARFGVLARYAKNEKHIRWFELTSCFILHNANAWEEEDEIVLITCRGEGNPGFQKLDGDVEGTVENITSELYEMRFNMKSGLATQKKLSAPPVELPRINESYTGRKNRYVYGVIIDSMAKASGIAKFNLDAEPEAGKDKIEVGGNVEGVFHFGANRFGSDFVFIPREPGFSSKEDDGYLIVYVYDENTGESEAVIIDAKTMSGNPVAVVELPNRVPYGFHATFMTEEQIQQQTV